ncbi:hypothetical protein Q3W71_25695 [Micromonospora sp. C28SCA-DRY-2]|uniref:hypothetical protein n=1 Tax=Micromonospora sp. C28SCA-DRY-2 TaxID=3059522 RepID=UPI002676DE7D|nr:hypothetical protein [Micromonospora sp. C28SCA-DRY-2]MDO3705066.1 hypothetical protein [Micromonospora sp. C28SCA-DRY-2]
MRTSEGAAVAARRGRTLPLLTLAAVPPALEAAVLAALSFYSARGLAPQATAVWPYDSYHDLRWLLVYHNSWSSFLLGLLAVTAVRGLLSAWMTGLAWPANAPRPSYRWLILRNIEVAALATVIISPWAALAVAYSAVALSWYLLASLLPMLVLAPFLVRGGVVSRWWRGLPSAALFGWSLLNFLVLTVAGALMSAVPLWWGVPVAAAAGVANGLLWRGTVAAAALQAPVRLGRVPVAPLAIVVTMAGSVVAEAGVGVAAGGQGDWRAPVLSERLEDRIPYAVIAIAGHDSSYDGRPAVDPRVERFSYRGLDERERPLPYRPQDTHRSVGSSAALLSQHIDSLQRRTGRPVALLGESEGAMVARMYLERWPESPVDAVVMFSPLTRPGRVYYPPAGYDGWGVVAGWELRLVAKLSNLTKRIDSNPDEPFVRSVLADAPFFRNRTLCPVAGVRMIAFLPTVAAVEAPPGEYSRIPTVEVPGPHAFPLDQELVRETVLDFLANEPVDRPRREYRLFQHLGAAWQAPPLAIGLNPIWSANREGDPAFSGRICEGR